MDSQKDFWEGEHVFKRRSPSHPVIEAFAMPKVKRIAELTGAGKNSKKPMTLLDIGAGNGYFTYYLQRFFDVTALDFSRAMLSICPVEKKVQASALRLPFKDKAFDVTFCANMLHYIEEPSAAIDEMKRVSSRFIVIIEPNRLNPFMVAISFLSPEEKLTLRFSRKYLRSLVSGKLNIISQETSGFILPNKTPQALLPVLKAIEPFMYPKIYQLLVTSRP